MATTIKKCDCKHKYQDKKYGEGNRVHNTKSIVKSGKNAKCTVCEKEN